MSATEQTAIEATATKAKTAKKEPEIITVDMLDAENKPTGRLVEFTAKRKLHKESFVDENGIGIRLDFANGQSRTFRMPESLYEKFAAHGAEQKLGDEIAGVDDIDDCVIAIDDLIDRLYEGKWNVKREANALTGASILAKALVEHTGRTIDAVRAYLSNKTPAEKMALRNNAEIAPIVARLQAEKDAKSKKKPGPVVDTMALLNELTNAPDPVSTETPAQA